MTSPHPTIAQRVATHLIDYPLAEPSDAAIPSEQLLNDVLDHLRMFHPGAYDHFVPPVLPVE